MGGKRVFAKGGKRVFTYRWQKSVYYKWVAKEGLLKMAKEGLSTVAKEFLLFVGGKEVCIIHGWQKSVLLYRLEKEFSSWAEFEFSSKAAKIRDGKNSGVNGVAAVFLLLTVFHIVRYLSIIN